MTLAWVAALFLSVAVGAQMLSTLLSLARIAKPRTLLNPPTLAPDVSIIRPLCGLDPFSRETLTSTFLLDYPAYEIVFCVADGNDPIVPLARELIAEHPHIPARLLVGNDKISGNPKLNNVVKGWRGSDHDWLILADSNVLMPKDYIQRLLIRWRPDTGIVSAPPIGSCPGNFAAEIECAFLNTYQARWQYAAEAIGHGFVQGKTMLLQRQLLEAQGGIGALGAELAEDAAATRLVHKAGLAAHLAQGSFPQPLGIRRWADVWSRQLRWARLRRATFPLHFAPELLTSGIFALVAAAFGAPVWGIGRTEAVILAGLAWYGMEAVLALAGGWRLSVVTPFAWFARDLVLPWLWIEAWLGDTFEWRGNAMAVAHFEPVKLVLPRTPRKH